MKSAVEFSTRSRIHVGLTVARLERVVPFYEALLGQAPTKRRPGYVKFEVAEPPVNLTLNEVPGHEPRHGAASHFGIQVKSSDEVEAWGARMRQAGFETMTEERAACCYAVQDKVWIHDPAGHRWEVFVVLDPDVDTSDQLPPGISAAGDAGESGDSQPRCCA